MSKKKKNRHRKKQSAYVKNLDTSKDTHHLCFYKKDWNKGYASLVRQFHYCMMELPKGTIHRRIHSEMGGVPAPRDIAAKEAYTQLVELEKHSALSDSDTIEKRLCLLISLFDYIAQPTADGFRKQLEIVQRYKKEPP